MIKQPLMPKATAIWLIENTALSFEQISHFCGLHILEVQTLADEEHLALIGMDPISSGQLTWGEIKRCEEDKKAFLTLNQSVSIDDILGRKKRKYTPLAKRKERPDAIAWLLKYQPTLDIRHICRLVATTKGTIQAIRDKTHWNASNIKPRSPITLGFCTQEELDEALLDAQKKS
jgi:hypothetical protein